jgi:hypothetical protein
MIPSLLVAVTAQLSIQKLCEIKYIQIPSHPFNYVILIVLLLMTRKLTPIIASAINIQQLFFFIR